MSTDVAAAARVLSAGGLVAFPTETVYGLGADARNEAAVARIFAVKGRPPGRALTVHLGRNADPGAWGTWGQAARRLTDAFWPGPLTVIVPRIAGVPDIVTGGQETVGMRVPDHPVALDLLDAFGGGLAAPSANRSGRLSPTTAEHVRAELGDAVDLILDGGACEVGVESSVLSLVAEPTLLRVGALPRSALEHVLGTPIRTAAPAPGYRPSVPVQVVAPNALDAAVAAHNGRVGVLSPRPPAGPVGRWIEAPTEPGAYARGLYANLRALDQPGHDVIIVSEPPADETWHAVADRLARASLPPSR